ncbi:HAD hydrolase [compost metagenome]
MAADAALMIGDDVEGDVLGAQRAGLQGCLVQTGKYRRGDEAKAPGTLLAKDLAEAVRRFC